MTLTLDRVLALTNPLMQGGDVSAVQHLLTAKGFPCAADGIYGPETGEQCVQAKKRLKYAKDAQTATCGQPLVVALEQHAPFPPQPLPSRRAAYLAMLERFLGEAGRWRYGQVRPIPHTDTGVVITDCSGAVTLAAELAGCPDPNGYRFNGQGWTGTIGTHSRHVPRSLARAADLVLFGPGYPWHHVAAVLDDDPDPWLFSHGRPGDPRRVRLSAELTGQASAGHAGVTFVSFLP